MPPSPLRVHLALLTVSLLFGVNYVVVKQLVATVQPAIWVVFRVLAATVILVPLALLLSRRSAWPSPRALLPLSVAALFGVAANQVLFTEGIARTTPEHSAIVNACIPTFTLLVAVLAGQERFSLRAAASIGVALAGVAWLLGIDRLWRGEGGGNDGATLLGDLLTMANGLSFAVHLVLMRRIARGLDPWATTAVLFVFGSVMIGGYGASSLDGEALLGVLAPEVVWLAAFGVLGATVLTYLLNTWALRHTHSSQVALYINVQPLVAALVHTLLGAPPPGPRFFVALLAVAFGLWLQTRRTR